VTSRRTATRALAGAAVAVGGLVARRPAHAAQLSTIEAVADATTFAEQSGGVAYDAVADGSGPNLWASVIAAGVVRRALLRFDLSVLPHGASVLEASLEAFMIRLREPQSIALHRLTAAWGEGTSNGGDAGVGAAAAVGDCTWSHRLWPSQPWSARGGDYVPSASASVAVAGWPAPVVWPSTPALIADLQGWIEAPASNHGWMMIGRETGAQNASRLGSRNNAEPSARPRLRVSWLDAPAEADIPIPTWALAALGAGAAASLFKRHRR
jgi:hypothetical protein